MDIDEFTGISRDLLAYVTGRADIPGAEDLHWRHLILEDHFAKFKAFIDCVEQAPEDADEVVFPGWVARWFGEVFRMYLDYVDQGGKDHGYLLEVLELKGQGQGHPILKAKWDRKRRTLGRAMAWVIYAAEKRDVLMTIDDVANDIEDAVRRKFSGNQGWSRTQLRKAWKSTEAVKSIIWQGWDKHFDEADWPPITELAQR